MKLSFEYGTEKIEFDVEYRKRKTLGIQIIPPGIIKVAAPNGIARKRVIEAVESKAKWIVEKLSEARQNELGRKDRQYVDGEPFLYLGRECLLRLMLDKKHIKIEVEHLNDNLYVYTDTDDPEAIKASIIKWYKHKAHERILARIEHYQPFFEVAPSAVKIKEQKKRWGSCTSKRVLLFNWRIIMAPLDVLDYIVVHEMCHFVHMNHSKEFWSSVKSILPDYEERKLWLKRNGMLMC